MTLSLPVVWHPGCLAHAPGWEFWLGLRMPDDEQPQRAELIRAAVEAAGAPIVAATSHDDAAITAVHDPALVAFLRTAHAEWLAAGLHEDPGQELVVPYIFPTRALLGEVEPHVPAAPWARTGFFCFDTMTPIGPGTWEAARGAADAALTAVDLVRAGERAAYAITRPPGHHVTRSAYGGSCYLNNAAIAAQALIGGGCARVAIVDVDAHHGNGAQEIFRGRDDVLAASVHVDPAAGWFPHFAGWPGEGGPASCNAVVAPGGGDDAWLGALDHVLEAVRAHAPEALVLALGVDAAADDPNSPLDVTADGYREAGRRIGALGAPTVAVQEGGYHPPTLGPLVVAALEGLEAGLGEA